MTEAQSILDECRERQEDEIVALQSIYAPVNDHSASGVEAQFSVIGSAIVELSLPVILPKPVRIAVHSHTTAKEHSGPSVNGGLTANASSFKPDGGTKPLRRSADSITEVQNRLASFSITRFGSNQDLSVEQKSGDGNPAKTIPKTQCKYTSVPPLSHLSPLTIRIRLPSVYPVKEPPEILDLRAAWIPSSDSEIARWFRDQLHVLYDEMEGMEVLWTWAEWLAEGMWRDNFARSTPTGLAPFVQSTLGDLELRFDEYLSAGQEPLLPAQLLSHSRSCTRTTFDSASFDCGICLEVKKGKTCTKLVGCGHVFCSECLTSYLSMLVDEGFHRQARRCPDPECVKMWGEKEKLGDIDQNGDVTVAGVKESAVPLSSDPVRGLVTQAELEDILTAAQLHRLETLTIKARMEADPSLSYCPREGCQSAVVRSSSDEGSGHWERFRECHKCSFAFCAWCSRSWHGPTPCPVSFQAGIIKQYLDLEPESPAYLQMQKKFGKKTLDSMVQNYLDEQETKQWLQEFTTPCPTCGISIEKSYGCNHMTCKSCLTHYCYLCGKTISGTNPYSHFNTPGYECYNRLFDGLLGPQAAQAGWIMGPDGVPINPEDMIPWEELI